MITTQPDRSKIAWRVLPYQRTGLREIASMPNTLNPDQILALAPDAGSAKAGQGLASRRKWLVLGCSDRAAWGECQGSARDPYRTQIDLGEPAFRCSCPSRKFPCKHGLGLFLLLASEPAAFDRAAPPAWVAEWLDRRDQSAIKRDPKLAPAPVVDAQKKRVSSQAKTAAARETRVAAGVEELGRWLRDLIRQGLAGAQGRPYSFWESMAARMVDAQAPGLARMVRTLAGIPASGEGWQARLLERLALLYLLLEGYQRIETLPLDTQADIRTAIGWSQNQDELLESAGLRDRWLILGQRVEDEDNLRVQRTWLWGETSARPALILAFAAPGQPLDRSLVTGTALDAELVYFPSAHPLRALIQQRHGTPTPIGSAPGYADIHAATAAYAAALAVFAWLERFPMPLQTVTPMRVGESWAVRDGDGRALPLAPGFAHGWRLLALSGGRPLGLFGEWNGTTLMPLSVGSGEEFRAL
jgi:SWIM zinc finger